MAANGGRIDVALDRLTGNEDPGASFDHLTVLRSGSMRFDTTLLEDADGVVTTLASIQGFDEMLEWVDGRAPADGEAVSRSLTPRWLSSRVALAREKRHC